MYGLIPIVIPPIALDVPLPIERTPVQQGDRPRLPQRAGGAARLRLLRRARPGARHEHRVLGAADPRRPAAARADRRHGSGDQRRVDQLRRTTPLGADDRRGIRCRTARRTRRMPVMTFVTTRPPLAPMPSLLLNPQTRRARTAVRESGLDAGPGDGAGAGADRRVDRRGDRRRRARRAALRRAAQPRGLVGLRGAGFSYDGLYYVKSVTHQIKQGDYKQTLHAHPRRHRLDRRRWWCHEAALLRQVPRQGREQRRPAAAGPHPGQLSRPCSAKASSSWAMPCAPYAGQQVGFFAVPPIGANVWVEFEGGDPDYPIWTRLLLGQRRGAGRRPRVAGHEGASRPTTVTHHAQRPAGRRRASRSSHDRRRRKISHERDRASRSPTAGRRASSCPGPQSSVNNGALEVI